MLIFYTLAWVLLAFTLMWFCKDRRGFMFILAPVVLGLTFGTLVTVKSLLGTAIDISNVQDNVTYTIVAYGEKDSVSYFTLISDNDTEPRLYVGQMDSEQQKDAKGNSKEAKEQNMLSTVKFEKLKDGVKPQFEVVGKPLPSKP